jgi:hypothetical protein
MFKRLLILLTAVLPFFVSCSRRSDGKENTKVPKGIISQDTMKNILEDIFIAESASGSVDSKHINSVYFSKHCYNSIFIKHHIKLSRFNESFSYYIAESTELEKILTAAIDDLSKKKSGVMSDE